MRKCTLSVIGVLLVLPQTLLAQCPDRPHISAILNNDAIGHYTQEVLQRADDGIARAQADPDGPDFVARTFLNFLGSIETVFYMLIDTEVRHVEYERSLRAITPCLHIDLTLIEAKMEDVRCELEVAFDRGSSEAIARLKSLEKFLNRRYTHLIKGATDPRYQDPSWEYFYLFDEPRQVSCCSYTSEACSTMDVADCVGPDHHGNPHPDEESCLNDDICGGVGFDDTPVDPDFAPICPFDSDYLAPNTLGYGCSMDVLNWYSSTWSGDSVISERVALDDLLDERDDFLDDIEHVKEIAERMLEFRDLPPDPRLDDFGGTRSDEIDHVNVHGCNAHIPTDPDDPKPSFLWTAVAKRGPFFVVEDQITLWIKFLELQHQFANDREMPDWLKHPKEFENPGERNARQARDEDAFFLTRYLRNSFRPGFVDTALKQAAMEAAILPKSSDMQQQVIEAMEPVRPVFVDMAELVTSPGEGLRKFVRDYAYFLRRSCINRPCKGKLEQVLRINFEDECYPYTSGSYQTWGPGNETWKRCRDAANP